MRIVGEHKHGKPKKKGKKSERTKAIKRLDTLASRKVRELHPICEKCGKTASTQACHIFTRNNMSTRWDLQNLWAGCFYCHLFWSHREPIKYAIWIEEKLGKKAFKELRERSRKLVIFSAKDEEKIANTLT
jgi:5-methylcytosine-specific restriction endonuclease McrA